MSIKLMSAVWELAPFKNYTLLTLLALADSAGDEGWSWPKIETLMAKTRLPERSLYAALKLLIETDWIVKEVNPKDKRQVKYRVTIPAHHAGNNLEIPAYGAEIPAHHAEIPAYGAKPPYPLKGRTVKNRKEPEIEPSLFEGDTPFPKDKKQQIEQVVKEALFPYYLEIVKPGIDTYTLTPARMKKGVARFVDCLKKSDNDMGQAEYLMKTAIYALSESDWHMGRKTGQPKKYNDWTDNLFASTEKLEKWLEQ